MNEEWKSMFGSQDPPATQPTTVTTVTQPTTVTTPCVRPHRFLCVAGPEQHDPFVPVLFSDDL